MGGGAWKGGRKAPAYHHPVAVGRGPALSMKVYISSVSGGEADLRGVGEEEVRLWEN